MQVRLLGPVEVNLGRVCPGLGGPLQRSLLAVLALNANQLVPRSRLISCLWGENPPASVQAQLHQRIAGLRRVTGRDVVVCGPSGYLLRVGPAAVDVTIFDAAVTAAREAMARGSVAEAAHVLQEALRLWRGAALGGVVERVADLEGPSLEERRLAAIELRIEAELELGRHAELLGELKALVAGHPLRERPRGHLMLALHRCGRTAEALEVYRDGRDQLVAELGAEPGDGLRAIHAVVLADTRAEPQAQKAAPSPEGRAAARQWRRRPPAQLPPGVADFVGDAAKSSAVEAALSGTDGAPGVVPIAVISGRAGVGKTALAVHAGHRLIEVFPDGQLYVDLRGARPDQVDPACALERFLVALGMERRSLPAAVEERTALFRTRTARSRMLVVLDGACDEAQVRPLLPGSPTCAVLVTSTTGLTGLEGARRIGLDVLEPAHALELLTGIAGHHLISTDRDAALEIVRLCEFLPLAVRIAGARLAAHPHWSLRRFAKRLADENLLLDELRTGDLDVRASLTATYTTLGPEARSASHLLAQQNAPEFTAAACARLMNAAPEIAEKAMDQLLGTWLIEISDIDTAGQVTYRFTPLVRAFLRERYAQRDSIGNGPRATGRTISLTA
jgi:DNA-binding SARP family transcriptional activator